MQDSVSLALARYSSRLKIDASYLCLDIQIFSPAAISPLLRFPVLLVNADFVNSSWRPRMRTLRRGIARDKCKGSFARAINRIGCKLAPNKRGGTNLARNDITIRIGFLRVQPLTPDRSAVNKARRTGFAICLIHPRLNGLPALRFSGPFYLRSNVPPFYRGRVVSSAHTWINSTESPITRWPF